MVDPTNFEEAGDFSKTDCLITVDRREEMPMEAIYESLRENRQECPIVVASDDGENDALIERIISDENSDFVFLPDDEIPFGVLSVRCKLLVSD